MCYRLGMPDVVFLCFSLKNNLDRFISRYWNPLVEAVDSVLDLGDQCSLNYAFPPIKRIPSLLCRIDMVDILIIFLYSGLAQSDVVL